MLGAKVSGQINVPVAWSSVPQGPDNTSLSHFCRLLPVIPPLPTVSSLTARRKYCLYVVNPPPKLPLRFFKVLFINMSRSHVLFRLYPESRGAQEVIDDPDNAFLIDRSGPSPCFAIGHFQSKCGRRETLVTFGRLGDIVLRSTMFSREQCSFEIDPNTHVIMFRDSSKAGTSSVQGQNATPFRPGQPRKVVVLHNLNTYIGSECNPAWKRGVNFFLLYLHDVR